MLNILIADDHPIFREGLKKLINKEIDMSVTCEAENSNEALNFILEQGDEIDVAIIDISLPGRSGLDLLTDIKKIKPKLPVLIFSMHPEERYAIRAIRAGANGYLSKEEDANKLIAAIHTISTGRKYITPNIAEQLANEFDKNTDKEPYERLSNREFEVMRMIALGKSVKEIAEILSLSINTVNTYRMRIMDKMKMKTNMEIAHYVIENNLMD